MMKAIPIKTSREEALVPRLFHYAACRASDYRETVDVRPVRPSAKPADIRNAFAIETPEHPVDPDTILEELADRAESGLMGMASPRFFGWVIGASHPVGVAADMMTSAWGQNAVMSHAAPAAAYAEKAAGQWILDLLDLPREASVGFVTGATMANFVCLAAARSKLYRRLGWDVDELGLAGAPAIRILIGEDAHVSVHSALQYLGFGRSVAQRIAADAQGRMIPTALRAELERSDIPAIVIAQAGQINTGGIDPFDQIVPLCREFDALLHVDGAFGLWSRACHDRAHLAAGIEGADSWATDGHKWLQLPYECGFAIVRDADAHRAAMSMNASYLIEGADRYDPKDYVPELSRRARGFPAWAVIRALGRSGIDAMISQHCRLARLVANRIRREPGLIIANTVTLNQVIVDFEIPVGEGRNAAIREIVDRIQAGGEVFVETAEWHCRRVLRISITSGETTDGDIVVLANAIVAAWRQSPHHPQNQTISLMAREV